MGKPIPAEIVVGPFVYTVSTDEIDVLRARDKRQTNLNGCCSTEELEIVVDGAKAAGYVREVVLHESLHALMSTAGLYDELGSDVEEKVVNRLSPLLLDLLRRNPMLVVYLRDGC